MKMCTVLIGSIVLLTSLPVAAESGGRHAYAVFIVDADGSNQRPLFPYPIRATGLACSPDGKRIAYSGSGHLGPDIWVSDFDGRNVVNLTGTSGIMEFGPSWSPDGSRIAFTSSPNGNTDVFVMDADGQNVSNLTNHPASDGGPVWSPDGHRFAFSSDRKGTLQIYLMNTDGSGIQNLTNNVAENTYHGAAAWSPDGNRIAYVENGASGRHIYLINVTGGQPQALVMEGHRAKHPAWSPDGSRIAFSWYRGGHTDIYVINPGGQDLVNLTHGVGSNSHPTWTPDGRIVFATRRSLRELDGQFLGPDTAITVIKEGGMAITWHDGKTQRFRLRRTNAEGRFVYTPLAPGEGERILRHLGVFGIGPGLLVEP